MNHKVNKLRVMYIKSVRKCMCLLCVYVYVYVWGLSIVGILKKAVIYVPKKKEFLGTTEFILS